MTLALARLLCMFLGTHGFNTQLVIEPQPNFDVEKVTGDFASPQSISEDARPHGCRLLSYSLGPATHAVPSILAKNLHSVLRLALWHRESFPSVTGCFYSVTHSNFITNCILSPSFSQPWIQTLGYIYTVLLHIWGTVSVLTQTIIGEMQHYNIVNVTQFVLRS
uniref:Uncharacterized protein n=1 Tax=Sinocyclocheilus rhinocerous TaxID=307959 RepID=A0A673LHA4_9TELE